MHWNRKIVLCVLILNIFQITTSYRIQESLSFWSKILDKGFVILLCFKELLSI